MAKIRKYIFEAGSNCSSKFEMVPVKVGDVVFFKCDVEQYGRVVEIRPCRGWSGGGGYDDAELLLETDGRFSGEYIGGQTRCVQMASDCSTVD